VADETVVAGLADGRGVVAQDLADAVEGVPPRLTALDLGVEAARLVVVIEQRDGREDVDEIAGRADVVVDVLDVILEPRHEAVGQPPVALGAGPGFHQAHCGLPSPLKMMWL